MEMRKGLIATAFVAGAAVLAVASTAQAASVKERSDYAAALAKAKTMNWETAEAVRGGMSLLAQFDSSGPDAWSAADHPMIYMTSESNSNGNPNPMGLSGSFGGFHIIDAYTKEVVASFIGTNPGDRTATAGLRTGPHGANVSPDGKWAYIGWAEVDDSETGWTSVLAVVNMRTLKLDKLIKQESYFQGGQRAQRLHHIQSWRMDDGSGDRVIVQWGFGATGGPHHILDPNDDNKVLKAITYEDIPVMGHPFTTPSQDGKFVYISIGSNDIRSAHWAGAGIAKLEWETGAVTNIMGTGNHPIGITHGCAGRYTYVVDGHHSAVYKIDNETDEVVGSSNAGVIGPYGLAMTWGEKYLMTVGKGEGTHNRGGSLGVIDVKTFGVRATRDLRHTLPIPLGGSASSIDHAMLHPDPKVNEMWISNMNGWETIVLDLNTWEPKAYIKTPNGGDTHSGAFVRYNADWTGEQLSDHGGFKANSLVDAMCASKE